MDVVRVDLGEVNAEVDCPEVGEDEILVDIAVPID